MKHAAAQAAHHGRRPRVAGLRVFERRRRGTGRGGNRASVINKCRRGNTKNALSTVTERAIADDGIVPKPARILANLVTLASPENVDALGRRFVDTLGRRRPSRTLHDQNKRVNHFARAVAHSGLFPALQLLTNARCRFVVRVCGCFRANALICAVHATGRRQERPEQYVLFAGRDGVPGTVFVSERRVPTLIAGIGCALAGGCIPLPRRDRWSCGTPGLCCATLLSSRPRRRQRRGSPSILRLTFF